MKIILFVILCFTISGCTKESLINNTPLPTSTSNENNTSVDIDVANYLSRNNILNSEIDEDPFEYAMNDISNLSFLNKEESYVFSTGGEGFPAEAILAVYDFNNFEALSFTKSNGNYYIHVFNWNEFTLDVEGCKYYLGGVEIGEKCNELDIIFTPFEINSYIETILDLFYPNYKHTTGYLTFEDRIQLLQKLNNYVISNYKINMNHDNSEYRDRIKESLK